MKFMIAFNVINFKIFGIPSYFFCVGLGFVITICIFIVWVSNKGYNLQTSIRVLFLSLVFMGGSARLFGCISGIYRAIGIGEKVTWDVIKNTGIVFYGGLIGLILSFRLLSKKFGIDRSEMDVLAVMIPLFHAITRVGCFFSGCCFGKESNSVVAIIYTTMINGVEDTAVRFPIQLVEALFNLLLFLFLLQMLKVAEGKCKNIINTYLLIYSIGRFWIEFLRGDSIRGIVYGISFSQGISICIWVYLAGINIILKRKRVEEERE